MATKEATALSALQRAKMIAELRSAFKYRSGSVARLLEQNMGRLCELMQQGKLTAGQLQWLKDFIRTHKVATSAASGDVACTSTTDGGTKSAAAAAATAATASKPGPPTDVSCSPKNVNGKRPRSPFSLGVPSASQSVRIARLLEQNMGRLCKLTQQGKITAVQMQQLKDYIERHGPAVSAVSRDVACATVTESAILHLCKRQKVADANMIVKDWLQRSSDQEES